MARQCGWVLAALLVAGAAQVQTAPQSEQRPPDKQQQQQRDGQRESRRPWWRVPHPLAVELALTAEQVTTIDKIFSDYAHKSKPLRSEVDQLDKALDRMMRENLVEIAVVEQESTKIEKKRAELNKLRTVVLYSIRRTLDPDQHVKYQKYWDRVEAERRKQDGDRRR